MGKKGVVRDPAVHLEVLEHFFDHAKESGFTVVDVTYSPIRGPEDRQALLDGIVDGTIDMIATDHAPHSAEEKSRGLDGSSFGIVGLETAFPLLYPYLVKEEIITMEQLMQLLVYNPRKRFRIPVGNDFSIWDMKQTYIIEPEEQFMSMGKSTPFSGWRVWGKCLATVCDGKRVLMDKVRK